MEDLDTRARRAGLRRPYPADARELRAALGRRGHLSEPRDRAVSRGPRAPRVAAGLTFECSCSRRELAGNEDTGYPGTCRHGPTGPGPTATRFRVGRCPSCSSTIAYRAVRRSDCASCGDFVVRRKRPRSSPTSSRWWSMTHVQGVSDVVRGADLLRQHGVADRAAGRARAAAHRATRTCPWWSSRTRAKLAKSRRSMPVDPGAAAPLLMTALHSAETGPSGRRLSQSQQAACSSGPARTGSWNGSGGCAKLRLRVKLGTATISRVSRWVRPAVCNKVGMQRPAHYGRCINHP